MAPQETQQNIEGDTVSAGMQDILYSQTITQVADQLPEMYVSGENV